MNELIYSVLRQKKCGVRGCYRTVCLDKEAEGFILCFVHLPERVKEKITERKKIEETMKEDARYKREMQKIRRIEKKEMAKEKKIKQKQKKRIARAKAKELKEKKRKRR